MQTDAVHALPEPYTTQAALVVHCGVMAGYEHTPAVQTLSVVASPSSQGWLVSQRARRCSHAPDRSPHVSSVNGSPSLHSALATQHVAGRGTQRPSRGACRGPQVMGGGRVAQVPATQV